MPENVRCVVADPRYVEGLRGRIGLPMVYKEFRLQLDAETYKL